jgi:hypothetical protein
VTRLGRVSSAALLIAAVHGLSTAVVLGAPLLLTLVVGYALWRPSRPGAVPFAWTLTGLLAGFNLLAMASIGVFLLPLTADDRCLRHVSIPVQASSHSATPGGCRLRTGPE